VIKKRADFLPMSCPSIGEEEIEAVSRCLRSGWITTGPLCAELERQFCTLTKAPYAVSVSSATAGMHLVLSVLNIGPGDEVITPSLTFASTVNMIALRGARPVFCDCDYGTLNMKVRDVENLISPRTKAIIPVHFAGAPVDMEPLVEMARRYHLYLIEDAAHAVGTYYRESHVGGFGQIAIFSFHPIKNVTTAEGGMITLFDPEWEKKLRRLRFHGLEREAWKRYGPGGNPAYDIAEPGYKYNLTDMQAALGLAQLKRLDQLNERRAHLAHLYLKHLQGIDGLHCPEIPTYPHVHAWHLFVVKVTKMPREEFMRQLGEYNIGYGLHFPPCHLLSYVKARWGENRVGLPETELAGERIISLPLFPDMTDEDVLYVCAAIREILK